jgi:multiple sugar transport system permease protein
MKLKEKRVIQNRRREGLWGIGFVLIPLAGFMAFFIIPFLVEIFYSLDQPGSGFEWNGLNNYTALFQSGAFRIACINTLRFIGVGLPLLLAVSMATALMIDAMFRNRTKFHSLWFAVNICPMVIPTSAVIFVVQLLLERYGIVNGFLSRMGWETIDFFHTSHAFGVLIVLFLWKNYSYCMVVFVAGLRAIDREFYDAAALDGAGRIQKFVYITLPALFPLILFCAVLGVSGVLKLFRESYLLFGDYPHQSVYMLQNFMNNNFHAYNYQQLSASSTVFFIVMAVFVGLVVWFNTRGREL